MDTLKAARDQYFLENDFGPAGGYGAAYVDIKLGPLPLQVPNTAGRVRAVRYHDLHHVLTGYTTDLTGEAEIAAWELAAGCRRFVAAWVLNLSGVGMGLLHAPRRTFRAFVRGRRSRTVYGEAYEALLERGVDETRRAVGLSPEPPGAVRAGDVALFALTAGVGLGVGGAALAAMIIFAPIALVRTRLAKRPVVA
jgi:hypothetical protein